MFHFHITFWLSPYCTYYYIITMSCTKSITEMRCDSDCPLILSFNLISSTLLVYFNQMES